MYINIKTASKIHPSNSILKCAIIPIIDTEVCTYLDPTFDVLDYFSTLILRTYKGAQNALYCLYYSTFQINTPFVLCKISVTP